MKITILKLRLLSLACGGSVADSSAWNAEVTMLETLAKQHYKLLLPAPPSFLSLSKSINKI